MSKGDTRTRKGEYLARLENLLEEYPRIFIVNVDNVGSNQMHQIRLAIRGSGIILMGKNTMVRKAIRNKLESIPALEKILGYIKGNIGLVFTKGDLKDVRSKIQANRVIAPARAGAVAPCDVIVPGGNTGMEPGKTSFFQALGIPTKIARGTIEIVNDVHLIKTGDKVGASEASLLNMLNISPFTYGLTVKEIYENGAVFEPHILDIEDQTLFNHLLSAIRNVACLSLAISFPTVASLPHIIVNGYKNVLAIAVATDYTFEAAESVKKYLADPNAFAAAAAPAAAAPAASAAAAAPAAKEEAKPAAKEEESDEDMGLDLFG